MKPLTLSINPKGWHTFIRRKSDPNFRRLEKKILERDQHTCQFCGFQAQKYQEVVNLDGDYRNNTSKNLVTACCFCSQCFFVSMIGQYGFGGGTLIYLPEMKQEELNAFCHVIFCAMTNETSYRDTAQTVYRNIKFRSQAVEDKYGPDTSKPGNFGQLLREFDNNKDKFAEKFLKDLRIIPSFQKFKVQLEYWAQSAVMELSQKK